MIASVEVEASPAAEARFRTFLDRLTHHGPGLARVAGALEAHVARVFSTEGAVLGRRWQALQRRTVTARTRRWGYYRAAPMAGAMGERPILTWTGRMRLSFREGGPDHVRRLSDTTLEFGSRLRQARIHARGKRPILGFADEQQVRYVVVKPFQDWLAGRTD